MGTRKNISLDDYAAELYERNEGQINVVYGSFSEFVKEKLKEECDEGLAQRRKRQIENRIEELQEELSNLEAGFRLETDLPEIDYEETKEHWDKTLKIIFENGERPENRFEKFIEGRYKRFRKNYHKVPFENYKEFLLQKASEEGYNVERIQEGEE